MGGYTSNIDFKKENWSALEKDHLERDAKKKGLEHSRKVYKESRILESNIATIEDQQEILEHNMMASVNISGIENNSYNNALRKYRRDKENNRSFTPRKAALLKKNQSAAANFVSVKENFEKSQESNNK